MSQPRVSVIIPTHNRAALLPVAVESARRAGGEPEIVVVDDASTDATPQVCRSLAGIRLVRLEKNVGLAAARNAGIRASTGEFIALLDDDDQRLPDSLPPQLEALRAEPAAAFCYAQVQIGESTSGQPTGEVVPQKLPRGDLFWPLLRANFIPGLSVLLRREALFEAGLFNSKLREIEDWDLWLRMAARWPVTAIERPVAIYRMFERNSAQLSSNRARMALAAAAVQRRAMQLPRARAEKARAQDCRRKFLAETRFTLLLETTEALLAGATSLARADLRAVARLRPRTLFESGEFRELVRLAFHPPDARGLTKRAKAVRKKLWDAGAPV